MQAFEVVKSPTPELKMKNDPYEEKQALTLKQPPDFVLQQNEQRIEYVKPSKLSIRQFRNSYSNLPELVTSASAQKTVELKHKDLSPYTNKLNND